MLGLSSFTATSTSFTVVIVVHILSHVYANSAPPYTIHLWDKNGDYLIRGPVSQCLHGDNCHSWYHDDQHGVRTCVSNNTFLNLTQDSEYDEYYLLDNQRQSIVEYALVLPSGSAGTYM